MNAFEPGAFLWCRIITVSHIWPPDRQVCCLFLLSIHSFPVLRSFGARLLSLVLQRQQHLEINNSSIASLLSSSLARSAPSWPYGSVLSRARLLLRTLAPRKQRKGEGCWLSSLHLISVCLSLSTLSLCYYLISFLSPSILERADGFRLSLWFCFSWLFSDWPSGVWQFQWIASASML